MSVLYETILPVLAAIVVASIGVIILELVGEPLCYALIWPIYKLMGVVADLIQNIGRKRER